MHRAMAARTLIQPRETVASRLLVAWQHPTSRIISAVGRLAQHPDGHYSFVYLRRAQDVAGFQRFIGFSDVDRRYESSQLFPLFRQRVMDPRRPDYVRYLETLGLDEDAAPMEILGRSTGVRQGDAIFLFPEPRVAQDGSTTCTFLVHGVRYMAKYGVEAHIATLSKGDELRLEPEPTNPVNPRAQLVCARTGQPFGWVPDVLLDYVHHVRSVAEPIVTVERTNGNDAPWHLRLCVRLVGMVAAGYRPFEGSGWEDAA
jgi:hypothetical protein